MNAIALHFAPAAAGLNFSAHQLFGVLMYREQGKSLREIAALLQVGEDKLGAELGKAERGEVERVPANFGISVAMRAGRKNAQHLIPYGGATELFLPRWQRAVLRQLSRRDGRISTGEAHEIRRGYEAGLTAEMTLLEASLEANGMAWAVRVRDDRPVYEMGIEPLSRLRALIANRWRVGAA